MSKETKTMDRMMVALATAFALNKFVTLVRENDIREPTIPTQDELDWIASLNSYRRNQWERSFKLGLTSEQRKYVDSQVKG